MIAVLTSTWARMLGAAQRALATQRLRTRLVVFYGGFYLLTLLAAAFVLAPTLSSLVVHQARADVETAGTVLDRLWSMRGEDMRRSADAASLDFGFRQAIATRDSATIISALDNARSRLQVQRAYFLGHDGVALESQTAARRGLRAADDLFDLVDGSDHTSGVIAIDGQIYQGAFAPVMAPDFRGWFVIVEPLDTRELQASAELASLPITLAVVATPAAAPARSIEWSHWSLVMRRPLDVLGPADARGYSLVVSYPFAHALAPYAQPFVVIAVVAVLGTLIFLWACGFLARMFTRPIAVLTEAARDLEQGREVAIPASEGSDELAVLARVFNSMAGEIKSRERELRLLLEEQSALYKQALAASRAKSEFMANMNHELRTPLNAIINFSEIIKEEASAQGQVAVDEDAERILIAARHLLKLVNGVLDLAKIDVGHIELAAVEFDVGNVTREVAAVLQSAALANNVGISVTIADGLGVVRADELRIQQCLFNLLDNAIKFSGGGSVSIVATVAYEGGRDHLVFELSDTGMGMTAEQLERAFAPFEQGDASTTRKFGGTGLGLSIVRGLSRALGGYVSATSVAGQGSTFTLRVPVEIVAESEGWDMGRLSSAGAA